MTQKQKQIRGTILALTGGVSWGFSGTCGQYIFANSQLGSGVLAAIRMLSTGILLLLFSVMTKRRAAFALWTVRRDALRLIAFAVAGLMFSQYAYLTAIQYSNSATATVFQNGGIILVMVLSFLAGRRLPRRGEILAAVLVLTGVFLLATHGRPGGLVISEQALLWGGLAALALATYTVLPGELLHRWGTPVVNGFAMLIGGAVLAVGIRIWEQPWQFSPNILLALLGMVLLGTLVAFSFYLQSVADIGPVKTSMLTCVEPVAATVFSALWLHTAFAPADLLGFGAVIGGCLLVSMSGAAPSEKSS